MTLLYQVHIHVAAVRALELTIYGALQHCAARVPLKGSVQKPQRALAAADASLQKTEP